MKIGWKYKRSLLYATALACFAGTTYFADAQTVTLQNIYTLPQDTSEEPTDGALIQGQDGALYGIDASGVVFKITTSGSFTILHELSNFGFYASPYTLLQGGDGNFYGDGFKLTPSGDYSEFPLGGTVGSDGYYYAAAINGGNTGCEDNGCGQIIRFTLDGNSSVVYTFTGGSDGGYPAGVMQASDGNLYGYSYVGGDANCGGVEGVYDIPGCGTLFKLTRTGTLTVLADLEVPEGQLTFPLPTAPIEAGDGNLYESIPGLSGNPLTIYKIALPSGQISILHTFPNSENTLEILAPGSGNQIYGFTAYSVFDITTEGQVESKDIFPENGSPGFSSLLLASDGNVYGNTGEIFRLKVTPPLPAPVQLSLTPSNITLGHPVAESLKVNNAFSLSMQQCYAFVTSAEVTTPLGLVPGTYNKATKLYTFSGSLTPTQPGTYKYAVTCGGIESGQATLTVTGDDVTTTTLTAAPNPVTPPASVTLTAKVARTSGSGTPTGQVTFYYGTLTLGSATLNGVGVAKLNASSSGVAAGQYPITCTYNGDGSDAASTSPAVTVTVQ